MAKSLDPDYALFSILTPLPGSKSYSLMKKHLITRRYSDFLQVNPVISYQDLSDKDLKELLDEAYRSFYVREEWLMNQIRKANSMQDIEADVGTLFFYLKKSYFVLPFNA